MSKIHDTIQNDFFKEAKSRLEQNNHKGDWLTFANNCDPHEVKGWLIKNLEEGDTLSLLDVINYTMFLYIKQEKSELQALEISKIINNGKS